ncbi:MAG: 3-keto-disaccharide hydrolase [Limisphaerales bacterium]|jgi:hypothetical protein|nr:DUF1080 domain-containing protein [Verrucomicrobiota bacterium]
MTTIFAKEKLALLLGAALIWMGASAMNAASADKAPELEPGFSWIFNGKELDGWDGDPKFWSIRDGAICGETTDENPGTRNTFMIWTAGEVKDFILRFDYRITGNNPDKWGNSGLQYRARRLSPEGWALHGYQADIDTPVFYTGILYEEGGREIVSLRGESTHLGKEKVSKSLLPHEENTLEGISNSLRDKVRVEDWNSYSVRVETLADSSYRLTHTINGHLMTHVIDASGKGASSGLLGLQLHEGRNMKVEFKHIRIKHLNQ